MTIVQIISLMHTLWNHEYTEMNADGRTFYPRDLDSIHSAMPKLLFILYPEKECIRVWAAGAWEDYRTMLRRRPFGKSKLEIKELRQQARDAHTVRMQLETQIRQQMRASITPVKATPVPASKPEKEKSFWDFLRGK